MPDVTTVAPVAADAIDRLTLGATDAQSACGPSYASPGYNTVVSCMAGE